MARLWDTLGVAAGTLIGARLAGGHSMLDLDVLWLTLSNSLLCAASMVFNDWHDVVEDSINRPDRPLPARLVRRGSALRLSGLLFVVGLAAAFLAAPVYLLAALLVTAASIAYSLRLKGVPLGGNLVAAALSSYPLYCWLAGPGEVSNLYWVAIVSCFLFRVGGEMLKTAEDVAGDRVAGLETLATRWGTRRVNLCGAAFLSAGVVLSWFPLASGRANLVYGALLALATLLTLQAAVAASRLAPPRAVAYAPSFVAAERVIMTLLTVGYGLGVG